MLYYWYAKPYDRGENMTANEHILINRLRTALDYIENNPEIKNEYGWGLGNFVESAKQTIERVEKK